MLREYMSLQRDAPKDYLQDYQSLSAERDKIQAFRNTLQASLDHLSKESASTPYIHDQIARLLKQEEELSKEMDKVQPSRPTPALRVDHVRPPEANTERRNADVPTPWWLKDRSREPLWSPKCMTFESIRQGRSTGEHPRDVHVWQDQLTNQHTTAAKSDLVFPAADVTFVPVLQSCRSLDWAHAGPCRYTVVGRDWANETVYITRMFVPAGEEFFVVSPMKGGPMHDWITKHRSWDVHTTSITRHVLGVRCLVDPTLLVLDVGANMGVEGLYAAALGCRVYSFEPHLNAIRYLSLSVAANSRRDFYKKVTLFQAAVSNGSGSMLIAKEGGEGSSCTSVSSHCERVPTIRLDSIVKENVALVISDAGGLEAAVWQGMSALVRDFHVHDIITSFNVEQLWTASYRLGLPDVVQYLEELEASGYLIRAIAFVDSSRIRNNDPPRAILTSVLRHEDLSAMASDALNAFKSCVNWRAHKPCAWDLWISRSANHDVESAWRDVRKSDMQSRNS